MTENTHKNRNAFVIHVHNRGFIKNRNGDFSKEFTHARLYGREKDAEFSVKQHKELDPETSYIIPVDIILDPKKIFTAILKGKG